MVYIKLDFLPPAIKAYTIQTYAKYHYVFFFSKLGFLKYKFKKDKISIDTDAGKIKVVSSSPIMLGTYLNKITSIYYDISKGHVKYLSLVGLGFKYKLVKGFIFLILGFSHLVKVKLHKNIDLRILKKKKLIRLESKDKLLLNWFI
jgi:ribosomal protein L6P/L9E